jgi:hypothetical protein
VYAAASSLAQGQVWSSRTTMRRGVVDDPAGDMPQAVAQGLGLGDLQVVVVQQQRLRPSPG